MRVLLAYSGGTSAPHVDNLYEVATKAECLSTAKQYVNSPNQSNTVFVGERW